LRKYVNKVLTKGKLFYILSNKLQILCDEKDMNATERLTEREDKGWNLPIAAVAFTTLELYW